LYYRTTQYHPMQSHSRLSPCGGELLMAAAFGSHAVCPYPAAAVNASGR
jgi:hypothetical protein